MNQVSSKSVRIWYFFVLIRHGMTLMGASKEEYIEQAQHRRKKIM